MENEKVPWTGYSLDGMYEAFSRVIESHPTSSPAHADAVIALRILRGFIPAMKQMAARQKAWDGKLRPEDLRIDTFSKHTGGFSLGLSSGVRITHLPTGLSVECYSERSQHRNRQLAFEQLGILLANTEKL